MAASTIVGGHRPDPEHLADQHRFALARAFADAKCLVDSGQLHVWALGLVVKEVGPANRADDATSPGVRLTADQWRRTLAANLLSKPTRK